MKIFRLTFIAAAAFIFAVSCGGEDETGPESSGDNSNGKECTSTFDCPLGYKCDTSIGFCVSENGGSGNSGDTGSSDHTGDSGSIGDTGSAGDTGSHSGNDGDNEPITGKCTPGKVQICEYQGAPETENVGPCKAAERTCQEDGTWGPCVGEVLPVYEIGDELCNDGIDNDCNGVVDDGTDFDGDGHGACTDCCETTNECPDPKAAWNKDTDLCEFGEEISYSCDSDLSNSSTAPEDYAKAIGICKTATDDPASGWGLISAKITAPNGNTKVHAGSNALLSYLGNVIKPKAGSYMLGLTTGKVSNNSFSSYSGGSTSGAPSDWVSANGGKFPSAPACGSSTGTSGSVNDAVMLEMKIRVPKTAKSFSMNIYFLSIEYPQWICSKYNDFFVALLDSTHTSSDPTLQNPADKNLAMDANGNPVGVNIAPAGLFTQCKNTSGGSWQVTSCTGTEELQGTGFESRGGTGWLTTRGNVVGGEVMTLRLAIWDLYDHILDSMVLIDNFKWDVAEYKPGTGQY